MILIDELMKTTGVRFSTSGIRGLESQMTDRLCFAYITGFLRHATASENGGSGVKRIAIAGDLRPSTDRILRVVFKAIEAFGLVPVDCGRIPTPTLVLYGISERIPTIMVSGSHIPEDRNGLKFTLVGGELLKKDEIKIREIGLEIPEKLFGPGGTLLPAEYPKKVVSDDNAAVSLYKKRLVKAFPRRVLAGTRIGLYENSSVSRDILYDLYEEMGAKVTRLGRSDSFLPIDTEAVRPEDFRLAKEWASSDPHHQAFDAILSTDGDGDRPLMFDEFGDWIRGDSAGIIVARLLNADCVVTPITTSTALERTRWFAKTIRTKIGSPYVVAGMNDAIAGGYKRVVGFEPNGGFMTSSTFLVDEDYSSAPLFPLPSRDAAIAHIGLIMMARSTGTPLSILINHLPRRAVMSDCIRGIPSEVSSKRLDDLIHSGRDALELMFTGFGELTEINTLDGLRLHFGESDIIHLRPSGNAPEFRTYTESETRTQALNLLEKCARFVNEHLR